MNAPEAYPNNEESRLIKELREMKSKEFLRYGHALLGDAFQKQSNSVTEAKSKGLRFYDVYVQETSSDTPVDNALAILQTPYGIWLRPNQPTPHFHMYFPVLENAAGHNRQGHILMWVDKVSETGTVTKFTVSEDGVQLTKVGNDELVTTQFKLTDHAEYLSYRETCEFFDEVKSYRLAPFDHIPLASI